MEKLIAGIQIRSEKSENEAIKPSNAKFYNREWVF